MPEDRRNRVRVPEKNLDGYFGRSIVRFMSSFMPRFVVESERFLNQIAVIDKVAAVEPDAMETWRISG